MKIGLRGSQAPRMMLLLGLLGALILVPEGNLALSQEAQISGQLLRSFYGHSGVVTSVAFSPDGTLLASATGTFLGSASDENTLKLWEIQQTENHAPQANFSYSPPQPILGQPVSFDASDSDGHIVEYRWGLGDGTTIKGRTVTHACPQADTYTAELTVTDNDGNSATIEREVEVIGLGGGEGPA